MKTASSSQTRAQESFHISFLSNLKAFNLYNPVCKNESRALQYAERGPQYYPQQNQWWKYHRTIGKLAILDQCRKRRIALSQIPKAKASLHPINVCDPNPILFVETWPRLKWNLSLPSAAKKKTDSFADTGCLSLHCAPHFSVTKLIWYSLPIIGNEGDAVAMKQKQNKQRIPDIENCPMRARIKRKQIKNKKLDGKDTKRCDTAKASSIA